VRPPEKSGAGALGGVEPPSGATDTSGAPFACSAVSTEGEPYIVDWKGSQRLDLELALDKGVAVVAYDCKTFKLIKDCSVKNAQYRFAGSSVLQDVVRMNDSDEVQASLPFSGATLGGEMQRGSSLEIAVAYVGRRATPLESVGRPQLVGSHCDEATHYVRSAIVGAFKMDKGTVGKVRAAVEIFGAGASAASASDKSTTNSAGELGSCKEYKAGGPRPPDGCRSPIQLELAAITAGSAPVASGGETPHEAHETHEAPAVPRALPNPCPNGFVRSEGRCTKADKAREHGYLCAPDDLAQCTEQCGKGNAGSCYNAGMLQLDKRDTAAAGTSLVKGCELGNARSCGASGNLAMRGEGGQSKATAEKFYAKGCDHLDATSCINYGHAVERGDFGKKDAPRAVELYRRSCDLGNAAGCADAGFRLIKGEDGVTRNVNDGLSILAVGCSARKPAVCQMLSDIFRKGKVVPANPDKASEYHAYACESGLKDASCGGALPADEPKTKHKKH
jgi:hypothetical protein